VYQYTSLLCIYLTIIELPVVNNVKVYHKDNTLTFIMELRL